MSWRARRCDARLRAGRSAGAGDLSAGRPAWRAGAASAAERPVARRCIRARARRIGQRLAVPIHDQGYRHYTGDRRLHARGWWVIARAGILARVRGRWFVGLLLFAWSLFVLRAAHLYIGTT